MEKTEIGKLGLAAFTIAIGIMISESVGPDIRTAYLGGDRLGLLFYGLFMFVMAWIALIIVAYLISPKSGKKRG